MDVDFARPASVAEVSALIGRARADGRKVRVRGAGHSVDAAIAPRDGAVQLLLSRLRDVTITPAPDGASALVEAGAGCHLGYDKYDPARTSRWETSLTERLDAEGFALDCLGGISHQTVSGFLLTGSAGGSLRYDAGDNVVGLELVDGRGRAHTVWRDADDPAERDLFEAAGVSMGLLGVVTKVWLRAAPRYDVVGREVTGPLSACAIDLFGREPGRAGLADLFRRHDYSRVLWWPQPGFDRVQVWTGDRARAAAEDARPFEILGRYDTVAGSLLQTLVGNVDDLRRVPRTLDELEFWAHLERTLGPTARADVLHRPRRGEAPLSGAPPALAKALARLARAAAGRALRHPAVVAAGRRLAPRLPGWIGPLTSLFVPDGEKSFVDRWHHALPMDNQLDDQLWPTQFAELWIPLERGAEAMRAIERIVRADGDAEERYRRVRAFPLEVYPGRASRFWLSPGYGRDGLRINPCRFVQWAGEPSDDTLQRFVDAVRPFDPRPHWGKHLPRADAEWHASLRRQLPRLDDFLRLRAELDPDGVFLTDYWRRHLGIGRGSSAQVSAEGRA